MKFLRVAAVLGLIWGGHDLAADDPNCQSAVVVHDRIASQRPNAMFVPLTAEQQKQVEDYLNSVPPVSKDHFDHVVAVADPAIPAVLLLLFSTPSCLRYEQVMEIRLFTGLIQGV